MVVTASADEAVLPYNNKSCRIASVAFFDQTLLHQVLQMFLEFLKHPQVYTLHRLVICLVGFRGQLERCCNPGRLPT